MTEYQSRPATDPHELVILRADLFTAVWELSDLDHWSPAVIEKTFTTLRRQPASTIQADLQHARDELAVRKAFSFLTTETFLNNLE